MSGSGSNARKLLEYVPPDRAEAAYQIRLILSDNPVSNYRRIAEEHGVSAELNDIYEFFALPHPPARLSPEDRGKMKDRPRRERFDRRIDRILRRYGVRLVALAGYDWVVAPFLCSNYVVLNVHPGDLRVRDEAGRRRYIGLGWIPTAKAILDHRSFVHATTHLVTAQLDGGPIARVSRAVPIELPQGGDPASLLPEGAGLKDVMRAVRNGGEPRLAESRLVVHSQEIQERLKRLGDWIEFPRSLDGVAVLMGSHRLSRDAEGGFLLDGEAVQDQFLQQGEE